MSSPINRPSPRRDDGSRPMPQPRPAPAAARPTTPKGRPAAPAPRTRRLDPSSWIGALILMAIFVGALWVVQVINAGEDYHLNRFGLKPREVDGLWGVVLMPVLHKSYAHMFSNTLPLMAIGWIILISGVRVWLTVTAIVIVGGGLLTWLVAPSGVIVGASGLVFGWLGYLIARAYFSRKLKWIFTAIFVLVFFGSLLYGLFPTLHSGVSWQAHLCGLIAGIGAGALLHPRGGETRQFRRTVVS